MEDSDSADEKVEHYLESPEKEPQKSPEKEEDKTCEIAASQLEHVSFSYFHSDLIKRIGKYCQQTFYFQKFVDNTQQCFAFTPQSNFPDHNLNFQCW